jgi:L-threonylcarbamoyladenylate synthase
MREFWPGPVSLILRDSGTLPGHMLGPGKSICVRVPDNGIACAIAGALGGILTATSANPAGCAAARSAREAMTYFRGEIDAVVDGGRSSHALPSTVIDVTGRETVIVREGAVSADRVRNLVAGIQNES